MTDTKDKEDKVPTPSNRLVEAPEGKGYFLTAQNIFVSSRPHVVENSSQVQIAANRSCLVILGTTSMTDEDFAKAYAKDAEAAISAAVGKSKDADPAEVKKSTKKAAKSASQAKEREAAEAKRLKEEEATRVEAEKQHQAELAAKAAEKEG